MAINLKQIQLNLEPLIQMIRIMSSTINEQTKREKPDVEKQPVKPVIGPGQTGTGIINE